MGSISNVHVLQLNLGANYESSVFRLPKGSVVQFQLGPSLFGMRVQLFTNAPLDRENNFKRDRYTRLEWKNEGTNSFDETTLSAQITLLKAGSYHYYFSYDGPGEKEKCSGSGYLLVDPVLTCGGENVINLDQVQCHTVLTKLLGTFDTWESKLRVSKESGFNVIHFTPVQELGDSISAYSIRDHRKLCSMYSDPPVKTYTLSDVKALVEKMKNEWNVLSISDIVLNHVANETDWLLEHPECVYNIKNSPHFRPAFLIDNVVYLLSMEIAEGKLVDRGLQPAITNEGQLSIIQDLLFNYYLPQLKIHEFFVVHVDKTVDLFCKKIKELNGPTNDDRQPDEHIKIIPDAEYHRMKNSVDMNIALKQFNRKWRGISEEKDRQNKSIEAFRRKLEELNQDAMNTMHSHLRAAVENVIKGARYLRLQDDGPKLGKLSKKYPLVPRYFEPVGLPDKFTNEEAEEIMYSEKSAFLMAHNGWVMGDDPLRNFAEAGSNVYLRREVIAWTDSVKLRFGQTPEDCPFLWEYMAEYVKETADIFHGIRLDNCHSTPLHVAEYMIDAARNVRPDLYVIAELFTSSETLDNVFVNRLGINSLIRENLSAYNAHELGRLVYRYGGEPVGSFFHPRVHPLVPSVAHALFMDLTHDNPSPLEKRSIYDFLPSAALVSMAGCGVGSNRGYDELIPHHIHVVDETRSYTAWSETESSSVRTVSKETGIIAARALLNQLHFELGKTGYSQVFVDQVDVNTVAITRHCPLNHSSVVLVARTAFSHPQNPEETGYVPSLCIPGIIEEIIFEIKFVSTKQGRFDLRGFVKDPDYINGLSDFTVKIRENLPLRESEMVELGEGGDSFLQEIDFTKFTPGSVIAFRTRLSDASKGAALQIRKFITQFGYGMQSYSGTHLSSDGPSLEDLITNLTLRDFNYIFFRCDSEEKDDGGGIYTVPNHGPLLYCGLQGVMSILADIRLSNNLGHPLCDNLRGGNWYLDYTVKRLSLNHSTKELSDWLAKAFAPLKDIPRYLVPAYADAILTGVYSIMLGAIWQKMNSFVKEGSTFVKFLALGSVILCSYVKSSPLPRLSPKLTAPIPFCRIDSVTEQREECCMTLAAGFPHFASGYMRNWGRDTFISLRGLLLLTGRFEEARFIILGYAACLRHGLIPNLLDKGTHARFNCRDAVWWWMQAIQDYTKLAPNGYLILKDKVSRLYPHDDSPPEEPGYCDVLLQELIQEALQRHFQGVRFRERNAGYSIDSVMTDKGFNIEIGVDLETGFVYGGNEYNCGTWMDKMGSSDKAGNKGKPGTPRNGSAVELVGLCKSTLSWLDKMYKDGYYPYNAVERSEHGNKQVMTFQEWGQLIKANFEKYFWINPKPVPRFEPHPELINRRGIYKDSYLASPFWADFQFRPNFTIAMVVAPELFLPENAWIALDNAEKILLGPLGMKTLDPSDLAYNGFYNNSDDSNNEKIAKGFNYHQGPEWVWLMGYFLRARLHFATLIKDKSLLPKIIQVVKEILAVHYQHIQMSSWRGLPELTNKDGAECSDSCQIQAWSHATILEAVHDLHCLQERAHQPAEDTLNLE